MRPDRLPIRYTVRYTSPDIRGIYSLPIWIPFDADPMKYARGTLSKIYPNGYEIVDLRSSVADMISDAQIELNEKYINRIFAELERISADK